jgi:hypothetical protein
MADARGVGDDDLAVLQLEPRDLPLEFTGPSASPRALVRDPP